MPSKAYEKLKTFLENTMRMSHIYQPLMLKTLLEQGGSSDIREIAKAFLSEDQSQLEYYENIVKRYPGQVLGKHQLVIKEGKEYRLAPDCSILLDSEREELLLICNSKLNEYVEKRRQAIWEHRSLSDGYIPGSLRYDILRRAKGRCECCGVLAEERAIDIDHIVPRNKGGSDANSNLQALCYQCNRQKRDRDDTNFAEVKESYAHRELECLFCTLTPERIVSENELAYTIRDGYPVSEFHTLVIPKRHVSDWFDLFQPEHNAIHALLESQRNGLCSIDKTIEGFNVGINCGQVAGQTIFHAHVHLIPRRANDLEQPEGGVRNVFPDKGNYIKR